MKSFVATERDAGVRADIFIARQYPEFSRASLEKLFEQNLVTINEKQAKPSQKLKLGDKATVDDAMLYAKPEPINLPILYEDNNVIVINKPAGILTHSKGAINTEATVASFIKPKITDKTLTGNRAGIVHRLDRDTSGLIITAKNTETAGLLQKQFSNRKVKKTYVAIVEGLPEPEEAIIDAPIQRNSKAPQTFRVGEDGKSAQTHYKVLETFKKGPRTYSVLELKPTTGRTHQLRVHLKYIHHPIVGDRVYGHAGDRLYLHAKELELTLPGGDRRVFESPIPGIFTDFSR